MTTMEQPRIPQFVDVEVEWVGRDMRDAIFGLFKSQDYNSPAEIRGVFEALFADLCVAFGWYADADGNWWRSPARGYLE